MLKLLTYPAGLNTFSPSPFCVKAALLLQASGQAWEREDTVDPRKMPQAKLPVLRTPDGLIHDSTRIRIWLESKGAIYDAGLSDAEKVASHALIRMAEDHMYFILLLDRWGNDAVWPVLRETYFSEIPGLIRNFVAGRLRAGVLKGMAAQGMGRMSDTERLDRAEADFRAISVQLGDKSYLFGDEPTIADFSIVPMLEGMRATPVATRLASRVADDAVLAGYVDRMNKAVVLP